LLSYRSDPLSPDSDNDDWWDDEDGDGNNDPLEELLDGIDNDGDADRFQSNGIDDDGDGVIDDGHADIPAVGLPEGVDEEHDLNDFNEVHVYRMNASNADSDGDGIDDHSEYFTDLDPYTGGVQRTNALVSDTDSDGLDDYSELEGGLYIFIGSERVTRFTNPLNPDSDGDGLSDGDEVTIDFNPSFPGVVNCTDPLSRDTDGDGMDDGYEFDFSDLDGDGLPSRWENQFSGIYIDAAIERDADADGTWGIKEDWDGDGLSNLEEYVHRLDPQLVDTDGDGTWDKQDIETIPDHLRPLPRGPLYSDDDGDLIANWWEVIWGLDLENPLDSRNDGDHDHLVNIDEFIYDLDPLNGDTDGDGESDLFDHELMSSPYSYDSDGDGIGDWWERMYPTVLDYTDPSDGDDNPDGDNWTNLEEWTFARDPFNHVPTHPAKWSTDGDRYADDKDPYPVVIHTTLRPLNMANEHWPLNPIAILNPDGSVQADSDMDRDGLTNKDEMATSFGTTDPSDPDTDADGMPDGWESVHALYDPKTGKPNMSPLDPSDAYLDPDWDGINYSLERDHVGNWIITHFDINRDGFKDPTYENETLCNLEEYMFGEDLDKDGINDMTSHPNMEDTDGDGIDDGWELILNDADGDLMSSWFELIYGLDPLNPEGEDGADGDPDGDGASNLSEFWNNTNPTDGSDHP
jgi:hypothetical protein